MLDSHDIVWRSFYMFTWTCSHLWREWNPNGGPASSGFRATWCWAVHTGPRTMSVSHTDHKPAECQSVGLQLCFPFSSSHKGRDLWLDWRPSMTLPSSPGLTDGLSMLSKVQGVTVCTCAILQVLDCLCNPEMDNSDKDSTRTRNKRRTRQDMKGTCYIFGLAYVSPLHQFWWNWFTITSPSWMDSYLRHLTDLLLCCGHRQFLCFFIYSI